MRARVPWPRTRSYAGCGRARPAHHRFPSADELVDIFESSFRPAVITVRVGTTVTWTNHDRAAHRLAVKGAPSFSRPLRTGDAYAYTFDQPGAFGFLCIEHPVTRGVVVVTPSGP